MKCHYCGADVAEGQNYCLWCGTRQEPEKLPEPEIIPVEVPADDPEDSAPVKPETPMPQLPVAQANAPVAVQEIRSFRQEPPRLQLPVKRALWKMILFGLLTLGIYPVVIWSRIVTDLNLASSRYDGKRTMPFFAMVMLTPFTLGIFAFVWMHKFCRRISDELVRRDLGYKFGPAAFWLWSILGSLILVGPFVFVHKLMKAMNKINAHFNVNG